MSNTKYSLCRSPTLTKISYMDISLFQSLYKECISMLLSFHSNLFFENLEDILKNTNSKCKRVIWHNKTTFQCKILKQRTSNHSFSLKPQSREGCQSFKKSLRRIFPSRFHDFSDFLQRRKLPSCQRFL